MYELKYEDIDHCLIGLYVVGGNGTRGKVESIIINSTYAVVRYIPAPGSFPSMGYSYIGKREENTQKRLFLEPEVLLLWETLRNGRHI